MPKTGYSILTEKYISIMDSNLNSPPDAELEMPGDTVEEIDSPAERREVEIAEEILQAVDSGDMERVKELAHELKSMHEQEKGEAKSASPPEVKPELAI